jgi:hypothetical protein
MCLHDASIIEDFSALIPIFDMVQKKSQRSHQEPNPRLFNISANNCSAPCNKHRFLVIGNIPEPAADCTKLEADSKILFYAYQS